MKLYLLIFQWFLLFASIVITLISARQKKRADAVMEKEEREDEELLEAFRLYTKYETGMEISFTFNCIIPIIMLIIFLIP